MTKTEYFEDYAVGAQRTTSGRTITEADVVIHAGHTGDYFPHHVDAEFARETPFGQRIPPAPIPFPLALASPPARSTPSLSPTDTTACVFRSPFSSRTRFTRASRSKKSSRTPSARIPAA